MGRGVGMGVRRGGGWWSSLWVRRGWSALDGIRKFTVDSLTTSHRVFVG
jgi:hypothetical protein